LLRQFDAPVLAHDTHPDESWAASQHIPLATREDVLRQADVLCLHLPYDKTLHHIIGKAELALMKPGSYLVNTSAAADRRDGALRSASLRHLAGAATDVFENEPYDGPLRTLDNMIVTPHIGSYARAARIKMEQDAVENLVNALNRR